MSVERAAGMAYRSAGPVDGQVVLLVHGYPDLDEYWKGFADDTRRLGHLELYRSGDFDKLAPCEGCLGALGVPALILWGGQDRFATAKMAQRFQAELPGSELAIFEDAGHFVWEDEPRQTTRALLDLLERRVRRAAA